MNAMVLEIRNKIKPYYPEFKDTVEFREALVDCVNIVLTEIDIPPPMAVKKVHAICLGYKDELEGKDD